jgi:hypothetical protein
MTTYTLTVPAYGKQAGETITLQPDDALVRLNIAAGVLVEGKAAKADAEKMTCPLCAEDLEMKRPPKFDSAGELEQHYADKHPAFVVPAWSADTTDGKE